MKVSSDQRGIGLLVVLASLAVVVVVGVAGYRVVNNADTGGAANTSISSNSASEPGEIKSQADVKKASQALDNTAIDSGVNPSQLDNDLNALL